MPDLSIAVSSPVKQNGEGRWHWLTVAGLNFENCFHGSLATSEFALCQNKWRRNSPLDEVASYNVDGRRAGC